MRDVAHDRVRPSALDEGPQLRLDIFGLLSRKAWHREISEITLARQPMAGLAIFELALNASFGRRKSFLRVTADGKRHHKNGRLQCQPQAGRPHDPAPSPAA